MRLDLRDASAAEWITLPLYPLVCVLLGVACIRQAESRTATPPFEPALALARVLFPDWGHPIQWWGAVFLAVGLLMLAALALRLDVKFYVRSLMAVSGLAAFWAVLLLVAAFHSTNVSYTSSIWLLVPIVGPMASARALGRRRPAVTP